MKEGRKPNLTQEQKILKYLSNHKAITTMDAFWRFGITRLASRISDLKDKGYMFTSKYIKVNCKDGTVTQVKAYSLVKEDK